MEMSYGLDGRGSIPYRDKTFCPSLQRADNSWGPPICYPIGTGGLFLPVKRSGREASNSLPSNVEVKNTEVISKLPDISSWLGV
jgi:hypothetical protein